MAATPCRVSAVAAPAAVQWAGRGKTLPDEKIRRDENLLHQDARTLLGARPLRPDGKARRWVRLPRPDEKTHRDARLLHQDEKTRHSARLLPLEGKIHLGETIL